MKKLIFLYNVLFITVIVHAQQIDFPKLTGPYLGQKPPGMTPEVFAPGIVSRKGSEDYGITFSRTNDLVLFTRDAAGSDKHDIYFSSLENGIWTEPELIPFSCNLSIGEPVFSPISDKIYFAQLRLNSNNEWEPYLSYTRKTNTGWEEPKLLMPGLFVSEADDGTLYYTDVTVGDKPMEKSDIAQSEWRNGRYWKSKIAESDINTDFHEFHPFVSPDGSYLIFDSNRPGGFGGYDIYIVFKNKDGSWGKSVNLGSQINSNGNENVATVSLDGKYLFFSKMDDIYWVSTKIIEALKPINGNFDFPLTTYAYQLPPIFTP